MKPNLSPVAVMGWGSLEEKEEPMYDAIETPISSFEEFPLNAFGRNEPTDKWSAFHMRADGKHCDRMGLLIYPYKIVEKCTPEHVAWWFKMHGIVTVKLMPHKKV